MRQKRNQVEKDFDFEPFDYLPFIPRVLRVCHRALILRNGTVIATPGLFAFTCYGYGKTIFLSFIIGVLSIFRRGVRSIKAAPDTYGIIHSCWTDGYYHWLTEALPRAICLKEVNPQAIPILPAQSYAFQAESLIALGFPRVEYFPRDKNIILQKFYLTECPSKFAVIEPALIRRAAGLIKSNLKLGASKPERLVYASRAHARGRRVLNESELVEAIKSIGGEVVYFEKMSFQAQVQLMHQCRILISNHGAGLANMMFMQPSGTVVELLPIRHGLFDYRPVGNSFKHQAIYWRLAEGCGLTHCHQLCKSDVRFYKSTDMANIVVNISKLKVALSSILMNS